MERLAAFIPQIKQANEELQSREPRSYCIDLLGADDDYNEQSGEAALPLGDPEDTGTPMIEMVHDIEMIGGPFNATGS